MGEARPTLIIIIMLSKHTTDAAIHGLLNKKNSLVHSTNCPTNNWCMDTDFMSGCGLLFCASALQVQRRA